MTVIQQRINGEWTDITIDHDPRDAATSIHDYVLYNPDDTFRYRPGALENLHLDAPVVGTLHGADARFCVICSCGLPFYGRDPDDASVAQLDHVESVMPDQDSGEYVADGTIRVWAARRAAQALGLRGDEAMDENDLSRIQDAITDLMWLAHVAQDTLGCNADDIAAYAAFMFHDEKGDN